MKFEGIISKRSLVTSVDVDGKSWLRTLAFVHPLSAPPGTVYQAERWVSLNSVQLVFRYGLTSQSTHLLHFNSRHFGCSRGGIWPAVSAVITRQGSLCNNTSHVLLPLGQTNSPSLTQWNRAASWALHGTLAFFICHHKVYTLPSKSICSWKDVLDINPILGFEFQHFCQMQRHVQGTAATTKTTAKSFSLLWQFVGSWVPLMLPLSSIVRNHCVRLNSCRMRTSPPSM